jgi:MGT family glycosyltransferase
VATICFFSIPATGHVNPALPLVRALVARGDRVVFFDTPEFQNKVQVTGAEFRAMDLDYDFVPRQDVLAPFKAMGRIIEQSFRVIPPGLAETRALQPDLILYDSMCPWGSHIAQLMRMPAVTFCGIMYTGWKNFFAWPRTTKLTGGMVRHPLYVAYGLGRYQGRAAQLWWKHRVRSPWFIDFFSNPGAMTLLTTSRYFQLGGEKFDGAFKFVGPFIEPRHDAPPLPAHWLDEKPLVYISLGTLFNDRADFFRTCVDAFRDAPYRVLMALGKRVRADELGALPEHIKAMDYVLQLEVLPRASVFITHAGMNSVSEAAWFGTPMVLAPQAGDQDFIAYQTEKLGAGIQIDSHHITPAELRARTEQVMQDSRYRKGSRKIGDSFRAAGGIPRALEEIDAFMQRHARVRAA